jgi:hypothetical protein
VVRVIFDEFWRLQREPVSERELADAKAYMTGSFPLTIETPDQIAMQVLNVVFYGLPIGELQTYRERVNAVSVDDVQRVARAYLKPDRLSVVLVGNVAAFDKDLKGVGFNSYETVDLANLDLTAADFKRTPRRPGAAVQPRLRPIAYQRRSPPPIPATTAEEGAGARALLERAIAAKGGLEKLRAVRSITAGTSTVVTSQDPPSPRLGGAGVEADATTYLVFPDRVRIDTTVHGVTTLQVYDGNHAWVRGPSGVFEVPAGAIRDLKVSLRRNPILLLLAAERGTVRARLLPDIKDDTGTIRRALELSGTDLDPVVLYIDPDTGLISKETYLAGGPGQPLIEELFSEYRPVDGVQVAYVTTIRRGGQAILEQRVRDITINGPLDSTLFERPTP